MSTRISPFGQAPQFTLAEGKKIQKYYWKDSKFRNKFNAARNGWLLQTLTVKNAVKLIKQELKKAEKRKIK